MRIVLSLLLVSLLMTFSMNAFGQDDAQAKFDALTQEATEHFESEEYDLAITKFQKAYELKPISNILYNIGRIYEKKGDIDNAIEYYDQFVVAPEVDQAPRQDALERLKTLREIKALREQGKEAEMPAEKKVESSPNGTLAAIFLAVGGASLITSGVFAILTAGEFSEFEDATDVETRSDAASSGRTFGIVADSLLVTGIVTTAVGAIFWFTRPKETSTAKFGPTFDGKHVGFGLSLDY